MTRDALLIFFELSLNPFVSWTKSLPASDGERPPSSVVKVEDKGSHSDTRLTPVGKKTRRQQEDLWVATSELPRTAGHPFYERLNGLFNEHGFDDFVEGLCAKFYADKMGRPSLAPGVYFRLLLVGYFEGIGSERGIAWRELILWHCESFWD